MNNLKTANQPNIDTLTGIHYGVISPHSVMPEALEDIYTHGKNLNYEVYLEQVKFELKGALKDYLSDRRLDYAVEGAFDAIEQDLADDYQSENDAYRYEQDGYILETSELGIYVIKSPYVTNAAHCSPCCPNAGDLDKEGSIRSYCLGSEWFEDGETPYKIEKL